MKKIVITGPECTGKTTLSQRLADELNGTWVPEYSREYLKDIGTNYGFPDIVNIANDHLAQEQKLVNLNKPLVYDTGLLVLKIWSMYRFKKVDSVITNHLDPSAYDLFVLCKVDMQWEPDPLRENPEDREELYSLYKKELEAHGLPYIEVTGSVEDRICQIKAHIG